MNIPPLLAFEGDIIGIIILVLSVLGIFVRAIKGNENAKPPVQQNRPEKLRTEIEEFLDEIAGNAKKPARPAPEQPRPVRTRPPVKQQQPKKPAGKPKPVAKKPLAAEPIKLSEQHLKTSDLSADLRTHLATYMQPDRVGQEVQRDLRNRIAEGVEADLGRAAAMDSSVAQASVHPLAKLLREPQGVRTAIALQEILQKPRALR